MIIDKMQVISNLTLQEKAVVEYILKNPESVLNMNATQLAKASYTSASTIIRLCQKLGEGIRGYADFKIIYTSEYSQMKKLNYALEKQPFTKDQSIDDIIELIPLIYSKCFEQTKSYLDRNTLIRCVNYIKSSRRVDIYGEGLNFDIANIACYKLMDIGIEAHAFNCAHWEYIKRNELKNNQPFNILISHTGKNPGIIDIAKRLHRYSHKSLCICGMNESIKLSQLCNEVLYIKTTDSTLELSNTIFSMSTIYVLDIIMSYILSNNFDEMYEREQIMLGERQAW